MLELILLGIIFGAGFCFPVVAMFMHFGALLGVLAIILPLVFLFDHGLVMFIVMIVWHVLCAIAVIALFGWWFVLVVVIWIIWWFLIIYKFING